MAQCFSQWRILGALGGPESPKGRQKEKGKGKKEREGGKERGKEGVKKGKTGNQHDERGGQNSSTLLQSAPELMTHFPLGWATYVLNTPLPVARGVGLMLKHFPFTNAASQWGM